PTSAVIRNETKPTPASQSTCVARRWRTSGSSPEGPAQIGTDHLVERAAWITAATIGAPAQTTNFVAPACLAARTCVLTSVALAGTVLWESTPILSRSKAGFSDAAPSAPNPESSAMTPILGCFAAR